MPTQDGDTIPVCPACDAKDETKICLKCHIVYCAHFASVTDNRFCENCISDFSLKETIVEKLVEHIRPDGTVTFSRKYQARCIHMQGNDWLFAATLIPEMTDAEIDATIEYHRNNVSLMLMERESRKLERYHKLAGVKITNTKHESQEAREKREEKEANKKTRTSTKEKAPTVDDMVAMITKLAKAGLTQEQITAMFAKGKE